MSYLLSYYQTRYLAALNFESYYHRSMYSFSDKNGWGEKADEYINSQKPYWNKKIFDTLKLKQPELNDLITQFWEEAKKEKYIDSLFGRIFADKINILNFPDLVFECVIRPYNSERKDFLKSVIKQEPVLMNNLHNKLLSSNYTDTVLLASYIDLLPSLHKEIKSTQQSIFKVLEKSKDYSESNAIKVLTALTKSFEHNQDLYDFIYQHFDQKLENFDKLRTKLNKLNETIFKNCVQGYKGNLCSSTQEYKYTFKVRRDVLFDYYKINIDKVDNFLMCLYDSIATHIAKEFNTKHNLSSYTLEITTEKIEDYPKIVQSISKVEKMLPTFLAGLPESLKNGTLPDSSELSQLLSAFILKIELENTLDSKEEAKNKMKI